MPSLTTVLLSIKGDFKKTNIQLDVNSDLNLEILQKYFKKKDIPECISYYEYDNKIIFIFGYVKGKKGTENKITLPDPHSEIQMYGDAIVIASLSHKWDNPIPFTIDQWNRLYNDINNTSNKLKRKDIHINGDKTNTINDKDDKDDKEDKEDKDDTEDKEDKEDEESEIISDDDKSITSNFDDEDVDSNSIIIEEEEELVVPIKKKKVQTYTKIDTSGLKEEISLDSDITSSSLRLKCINGFKFLEPHFTNEDINALEKSIFEASYKYALKNYVARSWNSPIFVEIYRQTVRSVMCNIHPQSPVKNPRLLNRILEGELKLYEIPFMTSYEMYPEKWFELKDKLVQREQKILEGNKSRATDQFKCRRCQKRECTYYELQTRSADEPMTIFITCLNCGKEWRQGG